MKKFFSEHKLLIISAIMLIIFFVYAFSQKSTTPHISYLEVNTNSPMFKGSDKAKTSIIQYSDFLCPSCSLFSIQVMPKIDQEYVTKNNVNFEFRPMAFIADGSTKAAMGSFCAADQNKFWLYHDEIYNYVAYEVFNNKKDPKTDTILTSSIIKELIGNIEINAEEFGKCLDSDKYLGRVTNTTNEAYKNGISGTPYILVGGQHYQGDMNQITFETFLKTKL